MKTPKFTPAEVAQIEHVLKGAVPRPVKLFACDVRYYVAAYSSEEARLFATQDLEMEVVCITPAHPNTFFNCDPEGTYRAEDLVAKRMREGESLPLNYGYNGIPPWDAAKLKTGEVAV
jgi:hypothetical protein